jgi:glutathionylspermidine synthase
MKRVIIDERSDWRFTAQEQGFLFHTIDGERYWDERAYYQFSEYQIAHHIEHPTQELHEMCLDMVERVVHSEALMHRLAIPSAFQDLIRTSWLEGHQSLYGRMDFCYDGTGPAKLLEYNADTPTSLYEAAAFQLLWLEQLQARRLLPASSDQYNLIAEALIQVFQALPIQGPLYFSAIAGSVEDRGTTDFLRKMAEHAGIPTQHIDIQDIGLSTAGHFVDLDGNWIPNLFKLHAWEHIFVEEFGAAVSSSGTCFYEPAWKALISNKGILPLLWEFYEGHPNLLPAYIDTDTRKPVPKGWVRKPFFSREGANIELCTDTGDVVKEDGPYSDAPFILQALAPLPKFDGNYTLIGSWVIGNKAAGMGIREDDSLITKDSSRFLPHVIIA